MMDETDILHIFEVTVDVALSHTDIIKAYKILSLHHLGDEECNILKDGKWVAKYPELEKTTGIKDASYAVRRTYRKNIKVALLKNGELEIL